MSQCCVCGGPFTTDHDPKTLTCGDCAERIGLVPMPPLTRSARPCLRCNGMKFVRVLPREHSTTGGEYSLQVSVPMFLTYAPELQASYGTTAPVDLKKGYGLLEVFVCHGCGFIEWYCPTVQSLPIHPTTMTELVDYESDTPYR